MSTRLLTIAGLLLLFGCGTAGSARFDVAAAKFSAFEVADERPLDQRATRKATEPYGEVTRLGDDAITPPGPQLLKAWLGDRLGDHLSGKKIVLKQFWVQVIDPAVTIDEQGFNNTMASTPGASSASGFLARWVIGGIESVKSDKTVAVHILGSVDDVEFSAAGKGSFKGRVSEANINSVIAQALDGAVTEIGRIVAK